MEDTTEVTSDGSPIAVYRHLPLHPEFTPALEAIPDDTSVLDLGCGAGRLANHLAALGHRVVGVDESPAMLAHLDPMVRPVQARIEDVRLDQAFDVVVLASHFLNVADLTQRDALLRTVRYHLAPGGAALLQRHDPAWAPGVGTHTGTAGPVTVRFDVLARTGVTFDGRVTYGLGGHTWVQEFRARVVDDDELAIALASADLQVRRRLDDRGIWVEAEAIPSTS